MLRIKINFRCLAIIGALFLIQNSFGCRVLNFSKANDNLTSNAPAKNQKDETAAGNSGSDTPDICRNAYYPVSPHTERKYRISYPKDSPPPSEYTERFSDFTADTFFAKTDFSKLNTNINWICKPEGLLATQYNNSVDMKSGTTIKIDTVESKGVSYPAESRWNAGEKWNTEYTIKETINNPNGTAMGDGSGTIKQDGEIVGTEEVTVPAGTFQTMKVQVKSTFDITVKVKGFSAPSKISLDTTAWFAKNTGMVKSVTNSTTVELLSSVSK